MVARLSHVDEHAQARRITWLLHPLTSCLWGLDSALLSCRAELLHVPVLAVECIGGEVLLAAEGTGTER